MIKKTAILFVLAIVLNALVLIFVWAQHKFIIGLNPFIALIALLVSLLIAIPLAVLAVRKLARYCKGKLEFNPATLFALGFFIFIIRGFIDGLGFGSFSTLDYQFSDTYIVIAHTHVMSFFALILLAFSAVYSYYPRLTGKAMNITMGYIHFGITLIGALLYLPAHYASMAAMPRRYFSYSDWKSIDHFADTNVFEMNITILLIIAQVLFIVNLIYSAVKGKNAGT